ncbi:MAG: hypothetical protein ACXWEW_09320, partial [Nitrososphaeraceae archaeon]
HGPARNKVRYIMSHYSKAIQYSDMEDLIFKLEGNKGKKWFDVFQRALRGLTHPKNGELIYYNYKNSKHRFYIKHEWLNEEKNDVLAEFAPNFDAIKDIPIEEIIPNNIEFHKSK